MITEIDNFTLAGHSNRYFSSNAIEEVKCLSWCSASEVQCLVPWPLAFPTKPSMFKSSNNGGNRFQTRMAVTGEHLVEATCIELEPHSSRWLRLLWLRFNSLFHYEHLFYLNTYSKPSWELYMDNLTAQRATACPAGKMLFVYSRSQTVIWHILNFIFVYRVFHTVAFSCSTLSPRHQNLQLHWNHEVCYEIDASDCFLYLIDQQGEKKFSWYSDKALTCTETGFLSEAIKATDQIHTNYYMSF